MIQFETRAMTIRELRKQLHGMDPDLKIYLVAHDGCISGMLSSVQTPDRAKVDEWNEDVFGPHIPFPIITFNS